MERMPRYKIDNADGGHAVPLQLAQHIGREVSWSQWPNPPAIFGPLNEYAVRVKRWFVDAHGTAPESPPLDDDDEIFLPRLTRCQLEDPATAPEGAPLYKNGPRTYAFFGWPHSGLSPQNAAAVEVALYFAANEQHVRLPASPWCELRLGVVLPELPVLATKRKRPQHDPYPGQHDDLRSRRIGAMFDPNYNEAVRGRG